MSNKNDGDLETLAEHYELVNANLGIAESGIDDWIETSPQRSAVFFRLETSERRRIKSKWPACFCLVPYHTRCQREPHRGQRRLRLPLARFSRVMWSRWAFSAPTQLPAGKFRKQPPAKTSPQRLRTNIFSVPRRPGTRKSVRLYANSESTVTYDVQEPTARRTHSLRLDNNMFEYANEGHIKWCGRFTGSSLIREASGRPALEL